MIEKNTVKRPEGRWPFTMEVLDQIELIGTGVLKIEAHDPGDLDGVDFLWGELTPHLELSEGEYMRIDQEFGEFSTSFGQRGCCGGDPTWGDDLRFLQPTTENAALVARAFSDYFSLKRRRIGNVQVLPKPSTCWAFYR